jgi:hypothetical protein
VSTERPSVNQHRQDYYDFNAHMMTVTIVVFDLASQMTRSRRLRTKLFNARCAYQAMQIAF